MAVSARVGPTQKRVNALLERFGKRLHEQFDAGKHILEDGGRRFVYDGFIGDLDVGASELAPLWERLDRMASDIDPATPWTACASR